MDDLSGSEEWEGGVMDALMAYRGEAKNVRYRNSYESDGAKRNYGDFSKRINGRRVEREGN